MSDDVTAPVPDAPTDPPRRRRPPSQSDIRGISTIATVPGGEGRGPAPAPERATDPPAGGDAG